MKRKFTITLFEFITLFAGLFAIQSKPAPVSLEDFIVRYVSFIFLVSTWILFRQLVPKVFPKDRLKNTSMVLKIGATGLLAAFLIFATFLFKEHFDNILYQLILVLLGINAFSVRFKDSGRYLLFWLLALIYYTGLGYISFQMVLFTIQLQTLVFAAAIASVPLALETAEAFTKEPPDQESPLPKLIQGSLFLGPIAIAMLVFHNDLPKSYLVPLILIPIIANLKFENRDKIFWITAILGVIFIVNLGALAILT